MCAPTAARDQLRAEADAEERHFAVDGLAYERGLVGEPGMLGVLVGVHRTAEDHDRVVARRGVERRGVLGDHDPLEPVAALLDEVFEEPAAARGAGLVDDRQDAHAASLAAAPVGCPATFDRKCSLRDTPLPCRFSSAASHNDAVSCGRLSSWRCGGGEGAKVVHGCGASRVVGAVAAGRVGQCYWSGARSSAEHGSWRDS